MKNQKQFIKNIIFLCFSGLILIVGTSIACLMIQEHENISSEMNKIELPNITKETPQEFQKENISDKNNHLSYQAKIKETKEGPEPCDGAIWGGLIFKLMLAFFAGTLLSDGVYIKIGII